MLITPLYNLGDDIKIKNDYNMGNKSELFKYHYYLDIFKYVIELSKIGGTINIYYGVGKVNTQWFRECELLTNKKRNLFNLYSEIGKKYDFRIGDKVCLGTKFSCIGGINYNSGLDYGKIEKIIISGLIKYKYNPKTGKKEKDLFTHESIKMIINGREYTPSEIRKEPLN